MFPDRRLLAEDVIQSGDDIHGYLSSHRIISTMTHRGDGALGPATGRRVHARTIADCVCRDNRVVHEWLVRDQGAIALQIGLQPRTLAQTWLNQRGGWNKPEAGPAPDGYLSYIDHGPNAQAYAQAIEAVALGGKLATRLYDEAVHHIGPCETTRYGHVEVADYWQALFAAMQVRRFEIEHLVSNQGAGRAERVALRSARARAAHQPRRGHRPVRYGQRKQRRDHGHQPRGTGARPGAARMGADRRRGAVDAGPVGTGLSGLFTNH